MFMHEFVPVPCAWTIILIAAISDSCLITMDSQVLYTVPAGVESYRH